MIFLSVVVRLLLCVCCCVSNACQLCTSCAGQGVGQLVVLIVVPLLFAVILFSFIIFAGNVLITDKRLLRFLR
jgi:hypothetical protein